MSYHPHHHHPLNFTPTFTYQTLFNHQTALLTTLTRLTTQTAHLTTQLYRLNAALPPRHPPETAPPDPRPRKQKKRILWSRAKCRRALEALEQERRDVLARLEGVQARIYGVQADAWGLVFMPQGGFDGGVYTTPGLMLYGSPWEDGPNSFPGAVPLHSATPSIPATVPEQGDVRMTTNTVDQRHPEDVTPSPPRRTDSGFCEPALYAQPPDVELDAAAAADHVFSHELLYPMRSYARSSAVRAPESAIPPHTLVWPAHGDDTTNFVTEGGAQNAASEATASETRRVSRASNRAFKPVPEADEAGSMCPDHAPSNPCRMPVDSAAPYSSIIPKESSVRGAIVSKSVPTSPSTGQVASAHTPDHARRPSEEAIALIERRLARGYKKHTRSKTCDAAIGQV